jgi:hypothetical protein
MFVSDWRFVGGVGKVDVAAQMFPDDPNEALNQLQTLEKTLFNSDPRSAQRKIMQEALHSKDLLP